MVHVLPRGGWRGEALRVLAREDPGVRAGDPVGLDFEPRAVHFFDPRTGKAL